MREARETLTDLIIGTVLWDILFGIIGCILSKNAFTFLTGTLVGIMVGVGCLYHMFRTLDVALDMEPHSAKRYSTRNVILRTFIIAAVLAGTILLSKYISPIAVFIGAWDVKLSAYIQRPLHKYLTGKYLYKNGEVKNG